MKNVNEFTGVFNKEKLHLGNVLGGGETRYFYQSLSEYQVLNFSICVPSNLTVALNCDGYDFVAYQSNGHYGYTNSPLMVAIVNQPLQGVQFDGVSSQLSFLNKMVVSRIVTPFVLGTDKTCFPGDILSSCNGVCPTGTPSINTTTLS